MASHPISHTCRDSFCTETSFYLTCKAFPDSELFSDLFDSLGGGLVGIPSVAPMLAAFYQLLLTDAESLTLAECPFNALKELFFSIYDSAGLLSLV